MRFVAWWIYVEQHLVGGVYDEWLDVLNQRGCRSGGNTGIGVRD